MSNRKSADYMKSSGRKNKLLEPFSLAFSHSMPLSTSWSEKFHSEKRQGYGVGESAIRKPIDKAGISGQQAGKHTHAPMRMQRVVVLHQLQTV